MVDLELLQQRHATNLKKSGGLSGTGAIKYEYILTREQLLDSYLKQANELGYPLRKEVKRNRYVLTSDSLEETLQQAIEFYLKDIEKGLNKTINNDITNAIATNTQQVLNTLTFSNGGFKVSNKVTGVEIALGRFFGKAFARGVLSIFKELVHGYKEPKKRNKK